MYVEVRETKVAISTAIMAPLAQPTNGRLTNRENAMGFGGIGSLSCIFRI
jgi:hypothetical protein